VTYILNEEMNISQILNGLHKNILLHMFRVSSLVDILACNYRDFPAFPGFADRDELALYGEAALYHDIGKAFIPFSIIAKPYRFTVEETDIMDKHPLCAEVIFKDVESGRIVGIRKELIGLARSASVFHHEWWNGGGYPYGIGYGDIPLIARITSVCDAYDAMTNNRIYRTACSHAEACRELRAFSGTQFDPEIIRAFLACEKAVSMAARNDGNTLLCRSRTNRMKIDDLY